MQVLHCVCMVNFIGWLELWVVWPGSPRALRTMGTMAGQLRLKWVQARVSQSCTHRKCPGRAAGAVIGVGQEVPGLSEQRVPKQDS